jgi:PEP-CTERM motif
MTKRSFGTAIAAAVLGSVALTAPSYAGSTLVTTMASFDVVKPSNGTASTIYIDFGLDNAHDIMGPIHTLGTTTVTGLGYTIDPVGQPDNTIKITFTPVTSGEVDFTFTTSTVPDDVSLSSYNLSGLSKGVKHSGLNVEVSAVPEPSSVLTLALGLGGISVACLARRKKERQDLVGSRVVIR